MRKLIIDYDRVKSLEDAFTKYPVEKNEYLICDSSYSYNDYKIGDIVYVSKYKYSNGKLGEKHLFVLVSDKTLVSLEFFAMLISSKVEKVEFDSNILLKKDDVNKLNKDSIVKTDYIYNIPIENIVKKIGKVTKNDLDTYINMYNTYKKNNN